MMPALDIEIIILAAGLSRRFGKANKLLLPLRGEMLIRRSVKQYLACSSRVMVIIGHQSKQIREALGGLDVRFIDNPDYKAGQQTSVLLGMSRVRADGDAVMIGLADQPLLNDRDLNGFISSFSRSDRTKIFVPYFEGQRGNPVLLPGKIAQRLKNDPANPTCRKYIDNHPELTHCFAAQNSHFTTDLDTPDDAVRLGIEIKTSNTRTN
jgi:molybdenum cofactor cytidylyltransferase